MEKGGNLFAEIPEQLPEELIEKLPGGGGKVRIERIVSRGHASDPDLWFDQDTSEWVVLLKGSAVLHFEDGDCRVALEVGDWIEIPRACRHRVEETSAEEDTVWLAVHWGDE